MLNTKDNKPNRYLYKWIDIDINRYQNKNYRENTNYIQIERYTNM